MGIVDTIFVGPLGPAAIGAVGTGSTMFFAVMVFGIGHVLRARHVRRPELWRRPHRRVPPLAVRGARARGRAVGRSGGVGFVGVALLPHAGIHPDVLTILQPYLARLLWSAPPLLVFTVFRRYLQAMNIVRPMMVGVVITNIVNAVGNWVFVYGHLGVPAMGAVGFGLRDAVRAHRAGACFCWVVVRARARGGRPGFTTCRCAGHPTRMWQLVAARHARRVPGDARGRRVCGGGRAGRPHLARRRSRRTRSC